MVRTRPQNFDSGGGEMRVRGNAYQVMEKYLAMARDASAAGDRIAMENYLQHAEHYYRMLNANGDANRGRPARTDGNGSNGAGERRRWPGQTAKGMARAKARTRGGTETWPPQWRPCLRHGRAFRGIPRPDLGSVSDFDYESILEAGFRSILALTGRAASCAFSATTHICR